MKFYQKLGAKKVIHLVGLRVCADILAFRYGALNHSTEDQNMFYAVWFWREHTSKPLSVSANFILYDVTNHICRTGNQIREQGPKLQIAAGPASTMPPMSLTCHHQWENRIWMPGSSGIKTHRQIITLKGLFSNLPFKSWCVLATAFLCSFTCRVWLLHFFN